MSRDPKNRRPILITGPMRSGTTWAGIMVGLSPHTYYLFEPFTRLEYNRLLIRKHPLKDFIPHITKENATPEVLDFVEGSLGLRYNLPLEFSSIDSSKAAFRMFVRVMRHLRIKLGRLRPLQKDPHALLSAPWLAEVFSMQVVVMIRHPAAFVSSLKKLNSRPPVWGFSGIEPLMNGVWSPYADEIRSFPKDDYDIIEGGALLWKMLSQVILEYRENHPEWLFVRHEDLARSPQDGFKRIYDFLDLPFTKDISGKIAEYSSPKNPKDSMDYHNVRRDSSSSYKNWKTRLTAEEVSRIHTLVAPVAEQLYGEEEW